MKGLLKFITCGSVDDGKSTLIGHILYDSKLIYADQEKALELDSKVGSRGGAIDYSLLLDGLTEEREQGITIDVAYRYFTTDHRSFIVADTPGHEEYTRNMAVGASFASLAVILIDASAGVLIQTKRHARICALMGIRHFVFAVNKMDLVDYSKERFDEISAQIDELSKELNLGDVTIIPLSATAGDNVTTKSDKTSWYKGQPLLSFLENVDVDDQDLEEGFSMPIQRVSRPDHTFRGFQGQIESGHVASGDLITILPSGEKAHVKEIYIGDRLSDQAELGDPVTITLDKEVDVSRGCVFVSGTNLAVTHHLKGTILWMDNESLTNQKPFFVKLDTKLIPGQVTHIDHLIDVNTGEKRKVDELHKNEIATIELMVSDDIVVDSFDRHKTMGEFILIDRITNATSACGVVNEVISDSDTKKVEASDRALLNGQKVVNVLFYQEQYDAAFVQSVENSLYSYGRHTYLYTPNVGEDIEATVKHLNEAGVIVLLYVTKEKAEHLSADHYFKSFNDQNISLEEIVRLIKNLSVLSKETSEYQDYI
jgi:sulfate adenylyltransferase subunit 1